MNDDQSALEDQPTQLEVRNRELQYQGAKWRLVTDDVKLSDDSVVRRDVVEHPGAVGVVALDTEDRVVLVQQYRHPVAATLWEVPAGLLDEEGETPLATAQRELFEEAHLHADQWNLLLDLYSSPGMSSEAVRVFLARGLSEVAHAERHEQTEEERDMPSARVPLDQACEWVLQGRIHNALAVAGLLATQQHRRQGWVGLRAPDTTWPWTRS